MAEALATDTSTLFNKSDVAVPGCPIEQLPISAPLAQIRSVFDRDGIVCLTDAVAPEIIEGVR